MNTRLDYSFPSFQEKIDITEYDDHDHDHSTQINNSFSITNVVKIFEEYDNSNVNISQYKHKRKNNLLEDTLYSVNQPFCENSHLIEEEEEFHNNTEENYLKIEDQNQSIIQEVNYYEPCNNDSFIHDTDFISKLNEMPSNSFETLNTSTLIKDDILEETEAQKLKKIFANLKLSKSINNSNNNNSNNNNSNNSNNNNNNSNNNNNKINECVNKKLFTINTNEHLNRSCVSRGKRGRKKILLNGIKTEIIDRKYIRKFKKFLKNNKSELKDYFDKEPQFWNNFLEQSYPPFEFDNDIGKKKKYKSYSKGLLRFIFSKKSARDLYELFLKEREGEREFCNSEKKNKNNNKRMDKLTTLFDIVYEKNLHKLYSDEYSKINIDDLSLIGIDYSVNLSSDI